MDPSEMTSVLRELQAREAYCLDRSGMWMAIREVWEDMADDEIAVLRAGQEGHEGKRCTSRG